MRSVCPSPSGWKPEVKCNRISSAVPRDRKKCDMNSEPQSEVTWLGTPCFENTWVMKSLASSGALTLSSVRLKIACFERRSTTTRIAVKADDSGSCSIKSIEIECQGQSGIGSCLRRPYGRCRGALTREQVTQDLTKAWMSFHSPGQKNLRDTRL